MKPIIFTCYNQNIDYRISRYQGMVVEKLRKDIPFLQEDYTRYGDVYHTDIMNMYAHRLFNEKGADCILYLDVDCIPLSYKALEITFDLAYEGKLVGNIQRSNHLENNQHVFAGPSYVCVSKDTYEKMGCPSFNRSTIYDTAEMLTVAARKYEIPIELFMPSEVEAPINEKDEFWNLAENMPSYGIGTTFSYKDTKISYHLFESRFTNTDKVWVDVNQKNKWVSKDMIDYNKSNVSRFLNKCHTIITEQL